MGRAIPALLAAVFVADVAARFVPVDPLTFRAWEALSRYRPPGAAFEPNRRYVHGQSYGDAAAMGNLPDLRQYRPEAFTTDARGFRNMGTSEERPVGILLAGDSFAVGSGVDDGATLSTMMSGALGCRVYNAAGVLPDPDRLRDLARDLGLHRGLVVHAYAEEVEPPSVPTSTKRELNRLIAGASSVVGRLAGLARGFVLVSPLRIASEKLFKQISNDRVLPNPYRTHVVRGTLANGDPILFVAAKLALVRSPRPVSADYWSWLDAELETAGLDLLVVLVPSKNTVYRSELVDPARRDDERGDFMDRLAQALAAAGVAVINLTPALAREAARRAPARDYLYWRDDIHWNREGIRLAADTIAGHPAFSGACERRHAAASRSHSSTTQH
jgi:hypothetical protein